MEVYAVSMVLGKEEARVEYGDTIESNSVVQMNSWKYNALT